jgi:glycosyltransferase A (GT-A) superfamily protein (DUF2064 family)
VWQGPFGIEGVADRDARTAHGRLRRPRHIFGPAEDGGFWALGPAHPDPELLRGVPMPTRTTGAAQREGLAVAGLCVGKLPRPRDVDTVGDAAAVAAVAQRIRFAAELERLGALSSDEK